MVQPEGRHSFVITWFLTSEHLPFVAIGIIRYAPLYSKLRK